jgi:hypothetical protein
MTLTWASLLSPELGLRRDRKGCRRVQFESFALRELAASLRAAGANRRLRASLG